VTVLVRCGSDGMGSLCVVVNVQVCAVLRGMSTVSHGLSMNAGPGLAATSDVPRYTIGSPASLLLLSMNRATKTPLLPPSMRSKTMPL
jgi:hypothetical protein